MIRVWKLVVLIGVVFFAGAALAQESWIQIEARPSRAAAEARAAEWDARLDGVAAFSTGGRWYAIAIGPYGDEATARARLIDLRGTGAVPNDAFVVDARALGAQVYAGAPGAPTPAPLPVISDESEPLIPADETVAEARAAERRLSRDDRRALQTALAYEGVYTAAIDGAFGPGTRRAIEAWQRLNQFETTGFLTTAQRAKLLEGYRRDLESLGLSLVADTRAGVEIELPTALLGAPIYDPPFARYEATDGTGAMVLLISQTGNEATLAGLYDILQTLEIVPLEGPRQRGRLTFRITGEDDRITSTSYALTDGAIVKGYVLVWPRDDAKRGDLVRAALERSFNPIPGVLPDVVGGTRARVDLLAGLDIRRPIKSRSGVFVSDDGAVLTSTEALDGCGRLTLGDDTPLTLAADDRAVGLALLRPGTALAPLDVASFAESPGLGAEIAVAGYPFGDALTLPTLTYGTFADSVGLDGAETSDRLTLRAEEGDLGGPVFNTGGGVVGLLQPAGAEGQILPPDVARATDAAALQAFLSAQGLSPATAAPGRPLAPEDLTTRAADITTLINCWR